MMPLSVILFSQTLKIVSPLDQKTVKELCLNILNIQKVMKIKFLKLEGHFPI